VRLGHIPERHPNQSHSQAAQSPLWRRMEGWRMEDGGMEDGGHRKKVTARGVGEENLSHGNTCEDE